MILPLKWKTIFDADLFFVGNSNRLAFEWIHREHWPHTCLCIYGPSGSGKTHLGMLWQEKHKATWLQSLALPAPSHCIIKTTSDFPFAEEELSLFYQHLQDHNLRCLWLCSAPPSQWNISRIDLKSRMMTMPCVRCICCWIALFPLQGFECWQNTSDIGEL